MSRFRLAGAGVIIGIGLIGVVFYSAVSSHFLGAIISRTLGPYSDALAEHGLEHPAPDIWQRMAERHHVAILVEVPGLDPMAFDSRGQPVDATVVREGRMLAVRKGKDGSQVTFSWTLLSFPYGHFPMISGLLVLIVALVGSAFWFLHRQLKPLSGLRDGVEAVARGEFHSRVPIVRDDEIGQVAEAFNEMAGRVGEMIDDRERLLADVSHELRSPIGRMKVALELMPEGNKRDALARDLREMENLVSVLLEREALRSRTGRPAVEDVDLGALVGEVVAAVARQGPGVELVSGGRMTMHADPALMKLLVQNLIDNAIKFSNVDSQPVVATLEATADHVILRIADDGIGIPPGEEEQLFKPFVKQDPARGHRVGYGIGLNLCQRIVQLHDGTIRLLPREPRGTEAVVTLPTRG